MGGGSGEGTMPTLTMAGQTAILPGDLEAAVRATFAAWAREDTARRIWGRDAGLWTGGDEAQWLGWLDVVDEQRARLADLQRFADTVREEGFRHVLLLGMGGSSLCPEVLARTFGPRPGWPALRVLDSTDPAQIRATERAVDLETTLVVVSSKSGTTLEPNIFMAYFLDRMRQAVGPARAGRHFVAVTDPGSRLGEAAATEGFRQVFAGVPSIGGRYSALSSFGLVPAAAMGLDVGRLLGEAATMVGACAAGVPADRHPGVALGVVLGALAARGHDKVTLVAPPGLAALGAWLEQLLAESTGKHGRGLIPVDREPLASPGVYGRDRLFVHLRLGGAPDVRQDAAVAALAAAGQPVVRIAVTDPYAIAAEFFRWEFATAVAGAVLGIHPFDQPDVEASKVATRKLTDRYNATGALPEEPPLLAAGGLRFFTDPRNAAALAGGGTTAAGLLRAHLGRLRPGDYAALLAYVEMSDAHERALQAIRTRLRDRFRVATCLGFGPRFLHSTGQAYKGGPDSGVFLQLTCDDAADLPVPGQRYSFGVVKAAQARGDFEVLAERGRRALRVHLGPDVAAGLAALDAALAQATG
jgi:transaldolase/glucose-6-phosphate isomerase